ncbi:MAG: hypothetical protein F4150_06310 [Chloroflexi bacterium]|nr:hypothetical protein [Chloroflexota bacterium]
MAAPSGQGPTPAGDHDASPAGERTPDRAVERIALAGAVAVLRDGSIAIRPSRARLLGPAVEGAVAAVAVLAIVMLLDVLSLWALVLLLLVAMVLGPIAVLGLVYNVAGSSVLVEREKRSVRYQQGLLGLGLGTAELVPFWRIARFELRGSDDEPLTSGERQDLVEWEVQLVKDNGRVLPVGSALAPRPLGEEALARARRLARALSEMTGAPAEPPDDAASGEEERPPEPGATAAREGAGRARRRRRAG